MGLFGPKYVVRFYIWKGQLEDKFSTFEGEEAERLCTELRTHFKDSFNEMNMEKMVKSVHPTEKKFNGVIRKELLKLPNSWCVGIFVPNGKEFENVDGLKQMLINYLQGNIRKGYILSDENSLIIGYL